MKRTNVANFARRLSQNIKLRVSRMPRGLRIASGLTLLFCGVLGFLPVLGFWMIPLGLLILSADFVWAKRAYARWLRVVKWFQDWQQNRRQSRDDLKQK